TRFDRCTTCHKGIAKPNYTKENLEALWYEQGKDSVIGKRLDDAKKILEERKTLLAGMDEGRNLPEPSQVKLSYLSDKKLTPARVNEFCVHPRLELFVGPNSKHPAEKFGCTSCHSGQPSSTSFVFAAHTPNDSKTMDTWKKDHGWEAQHDWDFPMLPQRFIESSCLKCHYQVTDLYSDGNKSEAPHLTKGYNLIGNFGCFGCHEINGYKGGRQVGPDMRLEPNPPLDKLTAAEKAKLFADPDNPPGTYRKVGPSLFRVTEKTNEAWAVKWIMAPREFRPDTKMPHYYGLSNNDAAALDKTGQEKFPATEIHGIAHYLFKSSGQYLGMLDEAHNAAKVQELKALSAKLQQKLDKKEALTDEETRQLQSAKSILALQETPPRLSKDALKYTGDEVKGRDTFTKKGCLACHSHASTNEPSDNWPAAPSEADFGPNLTQIKGKLVPKDGNTDHARIWLLNWLKNPTIHSPRTKMPITHLTDQEAADIGAWLLAQNVPIDEKTGKPSEDYQSDKWATLNVPAPDNKDLENLAKVYLDRMLAASEVTDLFEGKLPESRIKDLGADEKEFLEFLKKAGQNKDARHDSLLNYVGKKAIGRLGCYACHDIPGFESAKPIGTALAEWGKKDQNRLAFEDINNYVKSHFQDKKLVVDRRVDEDGFPQNADKGPLYEKFFYDLLVHGTREGYLHQKLMEPRSYDYNRIRPWDDRSRMPQFQFARLKKKPAEDEVEFKQRQEWTEALGKPIDKGAKPLPAESSSEFKARKEKLEADNREAVMTFILGLVAEPIPLSYLNQPGPERMAEIKGRQVLDKFNCAGCHVVRPGLYEFKLTDHAKKALGEQSLAMEKSASTYHDSGFFPEHRAFNQPPQTGPTATTRGVWPFLSVSGKKAYVKVVLTEALDVGFQMDGKDKVAKLRPSNLLSLSAGKNGDLVWPPPSALQSPEAFHAWDREYGTQGGDFTNLLRKYLKNNPNFPGYNKYGDEPAPFAPPLLLWQGERTQPDWLFQFLLDPEKVRELPVLRMPKFSLSEEDAKMLVDYFSAVQKRVNPDMNLDSPYPKLPQRAVLDTDYWKDKSKTYMENLHKSGLYETELASNKKLMEKMRADWEAQAANADKQKKAADTLAATRKKDYDAAKDDKKKEELKKLLDFADADASRWSSEKGRLDLLLKNKTLPVLEKEWRESDGYAVAGYLLLVNQCNKCHAVGNLDAQQTDNRGPSLNLASTRLRPGWSEQWIASPQRFLPYTTIMPPLFEKSEPPGAPLVIWLPGTRFNQVDAARDAILNLPRISDLPLSRAWMLYGSGAAK
ncbi:MAG TPA: c-type cytochrome, partial [Gemmataceae bacterium]|nr:c-type cytochrome [Gemmataceae bacterium]